MLPTDSAGPVSTDTRMLPSRAWFLALRGSRVDGHSYARAAIEAGCLGIVVDRAWAQAAADVVAEAERRAVAVVCVPDTASAVLDLGRASRVALGRRGAVVVGVTGSCGKTTTKEVAAACLAAQGASVHKTRVSVLRGLHLPLGPIPANVLSSSFHRCRLWAIQWSLLTVSHQNAPFLRLFSQGNENNLVGLPLTLLAAPQTSQAVVLEMGMSGPGEIAALTSASDPDVRVFTGVAEAHLAGCGGTVAGVAACKMEGLGAPGQAKPPVVILSGERGRPGTYETRLYGVGGHPPAELYDRNIVGRNSGSCSPVLPRSRDGRRRRSRAVVACRLRSTLRGCRRAAPSDLRLRFA